MILALLSDIHANLEALQACLKHAREQRASRYAFLGDFVGYGADPRAVVSILMQHAAAGAILVKGNHDEAVANDPHYANAHVRDSIAWARDQLSGEQKQFLASLPLSEKTANAYFVHASAVRPEAWTYVDSPSAALASLRAAEADYTFSGHVHRQCLFGEVGEHATQFNPTSGRPVAIGANRRWLALVGSVGQPRDGHPAAGYALFDEAARRITFYRVPYDHLSAAAKIRAAGLPGALAHRVEKGV